MSSAVIVHKGRTTTVTCDLGIDVSADLLTSQIRAEPNVESPLLAEWDLSFATDGTDGKLILILEDVITAQIVATSGYMDIKRYSAGEALPIYDKPLEVIFRGTVTE